MQSKGGIGENNEPAFEQYFEHQNRIMAAFGAKPVVVVAAVASPETAPKSAAPVSQNVFGERSAPQSLESPWILHPPPTANQHEPQVN